MFISWWNTGLMRVEAKKIQILKILDFYRDYFEKKMIATMRFLGSSLVINYDS
jgi:hypothetical protein